MKHLHFVLTIIFQELNIEGYGGYNKTNISVSLHYCNSLEISKALLLS